RSVGIQAGEVFQRVSLVLPKDKAPMIESGLMICLISRFNQGTLIDEIRISGASLSVAAGVKPATETAVKGIPYISK
ncbi:MAG: hypothetical protein HRT56_06225, partial [Coraliomargarita sp.]|nr:hypothetical protein [Coraliomargarita sp.]